MVESKIGGLFSRIHHLHKIGGNMNKNIKTWSEDLARSLKQSAKVQSTDQQGYQWKDRKVTPQIFFNKVPRTDISNCRARDGV